MSWRDQMRPASFRGVPFYVRDTDDQKGRKAVVHEVFAAGDQPRGISQDNGLGLGRYSIDAFVGGEDYLDDLEALEAALSTAGPGDLVHPFRGSMRVTIVGGFSTRQNAIDEGGIARVRFTAVPSTEQVRGLRTRTLPTAATRSAGVAAVADASSDFAGEFSIDALPAAYHESAVAAFAAAGAVLADLEATVVGAADPLTSTLTSVAELGERAAGLLTSPSALGDEVTTSITAVFESARSVATSVRAIASSDPLGSITRLRALARSLLHGAHSVFDAPELQVPLDPVTVNRTREAANLRAVRTLVLGTVVAETARTLTWTPYSSRTEALAALENLLGLFDQVDVISGDALFRSLDELRAQVSSYMAAVARTLPEVTTYTTAGWGQAVLIAQELYGDASRADEIIARNGLAHGGMIPPGTALEVLA